MGYNSYTTDQMVSDILMLSHMPAANDTFSTTDILKLAQWEIQTPIAKQILSTRGGYYLTYVDLPIVSTGLYQIPSDCIAGALANVELVQNPTIIPVNLIDESEQFSTISPTTTSYGFFIRGNYVQILPTPNIGVCRLWYFKRTSNLVPTSSCGQISGITGNTLTLNQVPSTFVVGGTVDLCGDQPPFNIINPSAVIQMINGTDVTIDQTPLVTLGDWMCLSGQTCIPQIPVEFRILCNQRVVIKMYSIQGYLDKKKSAMQELEGYEKDVMGLISPRVQAQSRIINPVNGGFLGGGRFRSTNFPAGRIP